MNRRTDFGTFSIRQENPIRRMDPDHGSGMSDQELLGRLGQGCEASWVAFYRRFQGRVYRYALQMSGSRALAEEAVQETFMALLNRAANYDSTRGEVASYVFGIARNKVLSALDRERTYLPLAADYDEAGSSNPARELDRRQEVETVQQAVLALPANYREAVVLCDLQQLDYERAAEVIDCPIGTLRSRLHRGRQMLAEKLAVRMEKRECGK